MSSPVITFLTVSWKSGIRIYWTLFKIAFPLLIIIRLLDDSFSIVTIIGEWMTPLMSIVNLPGETGIVLATAMLLQIYAAMLVLASLWTEINLTTAQSTVLMTMILVMHALPVELRIVQKAGVRLPFAFLVRFLGAFAIGYILHSIYGNHWLQENATLFIAALPSSVGFYEWLINQAKNWILIFVVIQALVLFVNILEVTHIERLAVKLIAPFFNLMGIGKKATTMTMIGMLLGLSYGGGLLIEHSKRQDVDKRDILCALVLLSLCHSVIEDTLLVMLVGAHYSGVFIGRVLFSLIFMTIFAYIIRRVSDTTLNYITHMSSKT